MKMNMGSAVIGGTIVLGFLGLMGAAPAAGAVVVIREGVDNAFGTNYAGTADNTISSASSAPVWGTSNGGGDTGIHVSDHSSRRRGLLRFDLSALSGQGLEVQSVTLKLTKSFTTNTTTWTQTANFFNIYPILPGNARWLEGDNAYNPAVAGDNDESTWDSKAHNTDSAQRVGWSSISGTPSWTGIIGSNATYGAAFYEGTADHAHPNGTVYSISNEALGQLVQSWIDAPADNAGMVMNIGTGLIGTTRQSTAFRFASSEHATADWRPALEITYVPEPTGLATLGAVSLLALRRRRRD